jgi:hypothetical protein
MRTSKLLKKPRAFRLAAFVTAFAAVATVLLVNSRAATPVASFETEAGSKTGVATFADAGASGGSAVRFSQPTPPPTGELKGWELTPTNVGLAPHGLSCATLPPYTGTNTPPAGTVISGKLISTNLYLTTGAVTIEKSCIRPTGSGPHGLISTWDINNCSNSCATAMGQVIIRDSEIDGSLVSTQSIAYTGAFMGVGILERNYFHDIGSGIAFYNTGSTYTASAVNNYVHKLRGYGDPATTGSHNESATVRDHAPGTGNRQLTFRGNYLTSDSGNDTGALFLQPYGGFIDNVTVENNLLGGGGYQLVLEGNYSGYGTNMKVINNRFSGTGYGPGYVDRGPGWSEQRENYRNDPTKTDNKGAVVNF